MDQYQVPYIRKFISLTVNPFGGAISLASLLGLLVLYFGGWPATAVDAGIFLAVFDLSAMFIVIFVVTEDEDWKLDVRSGLRPLERQRLMNLILFHCAFALAVTVIGAALLRFSDQAGLVLAIGTFVSGSAALTFMLLGRK